MEMAIILFLVIAGLVLLAIEFFLVPGFSIPGLAGIGMIIYGVIRANKEFGMTGVIYTLAGSLAITVILIILAFRSKSMKAIGLDYSQKGTTAIDDYSNLLNKTGHAVSHLRPAGIAIIDGKHCDVVTNGEYIEKGAEIIVSEIDGLRIVVTRISKKGE
jgi:membrane-bound serine protease (ClpP class)